jgi:hypothetical protein
MTDNKKAAADGSPRAALIKSCEAYSNYQIHKREVAVLPVFASVKCICTMKIRNVLAWIIILEVFDE